MKNEKRLDNFIFLYGIIAYVIIYFLLIINFVPNYASIINLVFIGIVTIISYFVYGYQKNKVEGVKLKILKEVGIAIFIYITLIYTLGLFTGYYQNSYSQRLVGMLRNSIVPLLTIITLEVFRYIFMTKNKDYKKTLVFGSLVLALFDVAVAYYVFEMNLYNIFVFSTVIVLPLICKNIVLSYLTLKSGIQSCLVYVIPLGLYKYFVPVIPNLGDYLTCIINISLPSMIFVYASRLITDDLLEKELNRLKELKDVRAIDAIEEKKKKKKVNLYKIFLFDIPVVFISSILIVLISGIFLYHLIGVDTSAISPVVSRGDAILLYKGLKDDQYKVDDIIVYKLGDKYIVDRIDKIDNKDDGTVDIYVKTKINNVIENNVIKKEEFSYRNITKEIVGKYNNFRVPKIAYPTIWFKEFINGDKNDKE